VFFFVAGLAEGDYPTDRDGMQIFPITLMVALKPLVAPAFNAATAVSLESFCPKVLPVR